MNTKVGMMSDEMEMQIHQGITLINRYDDAYNISHVGKDHGALDVMERIVSFLLASGFSQSTIDEYITLG
jgi:hypothetical protein